ncbi:MAG: hypothetical protein OEY20_09150 [Gemmatimonadota bacterium]|nr:hypothetical protein [Gemmatimonadota bacterium]MDH5197406.1 hypothetical protein [Gemmatimonadota bacterium]
MDRLAWVICAGLAVTACTADSPQTELPDPPAAFPHAMAVRSCAPWDGPATDIILTPEPVDSAASGPAAPPYVSIGIWQGPETLAGTTITWPTDMDRGGAIRCAGGDDCEATSDGHVSFRRSDSADHLIGTLELTFPSGVRISGGFRVHVRPNPALCG